MITLISKENVEYLLEKFPNKFSKENPKSEKSVSLLHYDMYSSNHANGNAFPNHSILLSVHTDCTELKEPFYRFTVQKNPTKRIIIRPMGEFDYENANLYVYKVEVQELTAEDTCVGFSHQYNGTGGTPPSYSYLRNPETEDMYGTWIGEKGYDFALWHTWANTNWRKLELCKLKVGIVWNRNKNKGDFDNFAPRFTSSEKEQ